MGGGIASGNGAEQETIMMRVGSGMELFSSIRLQAELRHRLKFQKRAMRRRKGQVEPHGHLQIAASGCRSKEVCFDAWQQLSLDLRFLRRRLIWKFV